MPPKSSPTTEASTSARRVTRSQTGQVSVRNLSAPTTTVPTVRKTPKSVAQKLAENVLDNPDKSYVKDPEYQVLITRIVANANLDQSNKISRLTEVIKEYLNKSAKKAVPRSPKNPEETITIDVNALKGLPRLVIEKIIQHAKRHSIKEQAQLAALFNISKYEFVPMIQKIESGFDAYPKDYNKDNIPTLLETYEYAVTHATANTNVMDDDTTLGKLRNTTILLRSDVITVELGLLLESHTTFLYKPLDGRVFLDITVKPTGGTLQISLCGKLVGKKLVIDDAFNEPGSYSKLQYGSSLDHDELPDAPNVNVLVSTIGNINVERASELLAIASKWIKKYLLSSIEVKADASTTATGAGATLLKTFITYTSSRRQK